MAALLSAARARPIRLVGPHRDELELWLQGRPLRSTGSSGQQRGVVLALVLWVAERTLGLRGSAPVLLVDDLEAELDPARLRRILDALADRGQVFLTSTRRELAEGRHDLTVYELKDGEIKAAA
jgi:DNA replication and repair protein RecF